MYEIGSSDLHPGHRIHFLRYLRVTVTGCGTTSSSTETASCTFNSLSTKNVIVPGLQLRVKRNNDILHSPLVPNRCLFQCYKHYGSWETIKSFYREISSHFKLGCWAGSSKVEISGFKTRISPLSLLLNKPQRLPKHKHSFSLSSRSQHYSTRCYKA